MTRIGRIVLAAALAALLSLVVAACDGGVGEGGAEDGAEGRARVGGGGGESGGVDGPLIRREPANAGRKVAVGSKNFPEQLVLGEIYSQALSAAGYDVEEKPNLGSETIAFKALKKGDIDAYPEYTGTVLTNFYDVSAGDVPRDPEAAFRLSEQRLRRDDIKAMPRTPFENSYRLGAKKETAERLGARTTSQLAPKTKGLKITGYPECRRRLDCYVGVKRTYDTSFKDYVPSEQTYEVLDQEEADVGFLFTTDPKLATGMYRTFEDDKDLFPPYNVSFLVREEAAKRLGPGAQQVIERIQRPMTNDLMIELNSRVVLEKKKPQEVAREYLRAEGFVR